MAIQGLILRGEYRGSKTVQFFGENDQTETYVEHTIETEYDNGYPKAWHIKDRKKEFTAQKGEIVELQITAVAKRSQTGQPYLAYMIPDKEKKPLTRAARPRPSQDKEYQDFLNWKRMNQR